MSENLLRRLSALSSETLRGLKRGVEKESLRVRSDGLLSTRPHPIGLGSALTHPTITTDFSEAQIEMVTGAHDSVEACLQELAQIHQEVYRQIDDEYLWAASMPCYLPADDAIPLARFGTSNVGRAKYVYRNGLSWRYGRRMQTISGVHYNFSLPDSAWAELWQERHGRTNGANGADPERLRDSRDAGYFGLIRNFRRHSWLLLYLFGASPAVCPSFVEGRTHDLLPRGPALVMPFGTSLRMGPLGYQSDAQRSLAVSYNCLRSYAQSLAYGLAERWPAYQRIGILVDGEYRQLNDTLLQIENEFYGTIRPKRRIHPGERALHALNERGVEYVEVRCLDIDPFSPIGLAAPTARFVDLFLLHCLLSDSAPDTPESLAIDARNQVASAARGRDPALMLELEGGGMRSLREWGEDIVERLVPIAERIDNAWGGDPLYSEALAAARRCLHEPALTPSARVLAEMALRHEGSFERFARERSRAWRECTTRIEIPAERSIAFEATARESLAEQAAIEASDTIDFETYRRAYLEQDLGVAPIPQVLPGRGESHERTQERGN